MLEYEFPNKDTVNITLDGLMTPREFLKFHEELQNTGNTKRYGLVHIGSRICEGSPPRLSYRILREKELDLIKREDRR